MTNEWTLKNQTTGVEKTCAEWGAAGVTVSLVSQGVSTCSFLLDGARYDSDCPFVERQTVLLRYRGTTVFYGRVTAVDRAANGSAESLTVTLGDPWWYLNNITYEQRRYLLEDPEAEPEPESDGETDGPKYAVFSGRAVLNQSLDGEPMDTAEQIAEALDFAITCYHVPLQVGALPENVVVPFQEINSRTVAEVIGLMLRYTPDAVSWFDYTTSPPTLHFTRRADAQALTLDLGAGVEITDGRILARHDLLRTGVRIIWDYGNNKGNYTPKTDVAGTGGEYNIQNLVVTVPLQPGTPPTPQQYHVDYEPINAGDPAWWIKKGRIPEEATDIAIDEPKRQPEVHREIVGGAFPPGFEGAEKGAMVTCLATYKIKNSSGAAKEVIKTPLAVSLNGTTVVQEDWTLYEGGSDGETPPVGLAAQLLAAISELQYEATLTLTGREVEPQRFHPGQVLNLAGGRAEWANARMQLQAVTLALDSGVTTLTVGPTPLLSAADYVELLRALRDRKASAYFEGRVSGTATTAKTKDGGVTANTGGGSSEAFVASQIMIGSPGGSAASDAHKLTLDANQGILEVRHNGNDARIITISLADLDTADVQYNNIEVKLRKLDVCDGGENKKIYLLCSEPLPK